MQAPDQGAVLLFSGLGFAERFERFPSEQRFW
jgi:hypothetical protein